MPVERPRPTKESEQSQTPRQRLEKFLIGEKAYSISSMAIGDRARQEYVDFNLRLYGNDFNPGKTHIEFIAAKAALNETMRNRRLGESGGQYLDIFNNCVDLIHHYTEKDIYRVIRKSDGASVINTRVFKEEVLVQIEKDLSDINEEKRLTAQGRE